MTEQQVQVALTKVPEVTLGFWAIKNSGDDAR